MVINNQKESLMPKTKLSQEQENTVEQVEKVVLDITECLRGVVPINHEIVVLPAYILAVASTNAEPMSITFQDLIDGKLIDDYTLISQIRKNLNDVAWESLKRLLDKYSTDDFRQAALVPDRNNNDTTPETVIALVNAIMDIQGGELIADIGCGSGAFLIDTAEQQPSAEYYGYEIDAYKSINALIRSKLSKSKIIIRHCDAFALVGDQVSNLMPESGFDYVFSNFPFGVKMRAFEETSGVRNLFDQFPELMKTTTADWLFNALLISIIKPQGKAISITTNGSTWNQTDIGIRKHFVEKGFIEAIISLPERVFNNTIIPTTMYVLSQGNKSIRLIDATKIIQKGRRSNSFSPKDISIIIDALSKDSDYSKKLDINKFRENEYILNPNQHMAEAVEFDNGVLFGEIINGISRGAPLTASQLDHLVSTAPTNLQYLMLANIKEGIIDGDLSHLTTIEPKYDKYCLHPGNLIVSKNGPPFKTAVVDANLKNKTIANGNLYIIELNERVANPYYIQAFLESAKGIAQLVNNSVGTTLLSIGVERLKSLVIPLPSLEEQAHIANKYLSAQDEVRLLRRKLDKAHDRLQHIYDTESEDL